MQTSISSSFYTSASKKRVDKEIMEGEKEMNLIEECENHSSIKENKVEVGFHT